MSTIATAWAVHKRERQLRRDLRTVLRAAGIYEPTDMTTVCERLSAIRSKPIIPVAFDFAAGDPYGAWVARKTTDWIAYQSQTSPAHQQHIIAHELGHILAGHQPPAGDPVNVVSDDPWSGKVLRRTSYDSDDERDAETVATLLLQAAAAGEGVVQPGVTGRARVAQQALGDRFEWL